MSDLFQRVSYQNINKYLTYILLLLLIWATLWTLRGEEAVPPNGHLFNLMVVFISAYIVGHMVSLIGLPPLLGMLITGFVFGNAFDINLDRNLCSILRSTALVIILLRAGLELDPKAIRKLSSVCLRLSFTPCLVEAVCVAVVSHLLLDFPLVWGFLLGFVLAAVSPAVVVPGIIALQEKGYGVDKGVPTLVIAAASVDDVLAITGFGLCLGLLFDSQSSIVWSVIRGPIEALIGIGFGIVIGLILWYIPPKEESVNQRISILLLSGMSVLLGSIQLNMSGVGPLACLVMSFVAALKWRQNNVMNQQIQQNLKIFWLIFQPFLFALIGTEVKLSQMKTEFIGLAFITLTIGLILRTVTAMAVVFGAQLNWKEKVFIGCAWLPKATVQAAVGPIALDLARNRNDLKSIDLANLVLTIAVLSIVITAPLGAIIIALFGPKLLNKSTKSDKQLEETKEKEEDIQQLSELIST